MTRHAIKGRLERTKLTWCILKGRWLERPELNLMGTFHWGFRVTSFLKIGVPFLALQAGDSVEARWSRVLPGVQEEIVKNLDEKTQEGKTKIERNKS